MPFAFGAAKGETTGAKTRDMEIKIARMVRIMAKDRNTSNPNTLSVGTGECALKTFDDASFVFRQYVRQFLQMMIKIMRPDANSQDTIAFQRGSLFYRRADPTPPAISIVVEIAVDVAHVEL